ncbi:hypothetical protein JOQ06_019720 [Pogonophryne albipinna]|uniref:G-protein coupled receptors family 1 profile domain-containing protein n=1 Tax=Pogonophryne albipinna TaxID=1090488 RepID=A0AAD6FVV6_9TELE|nr:hypothetical protein JOQ06_019720 [Pogonophryne albipinna]
MSGNSDCEECLSSAHVANISAELHPIDDDDELLRYIWREYLHPKQYEWVLIVAYIIVFFVSLIGNSLVCFAVWKNRHMRTVTNYFIVNLSFADVLVTIICLPASLVVDITETWFFGKTLCKVVPYLQTISVSVSVLTLSCIAQDRWYAICHPLMFKSTAKRARKSIVVIWVVSCIIMIPQAIVMECSSLLPELTNKTSLFTVCDEHWGAEVYPKVYHTCFFIVTYFAPLCLMVLAYIQICHKLWCPQIPGSTSVLQKKWRSIQCSASAPASGEPVRVRTSTVCAEIKQVRARRKTARMLIVVLFVFALCYLPISVLNVMKRYLLNSFRVKCWSPEEAHCSDRDLHNDECISQMDPALILGADSKCKKAFLDTLGTALHYPCQCKGMHNDDLLTCNLIHDLLHNRSHFSYLLFAFATAVLVGVVVLVPLAVVSKIWMLRRRDKTKFHHPEKSNCAVNP